MPITWSGDATTVDIEGTTRELFDFAERIEQCSAIQPVSLEQSGMGSQLEALTMRLDIGLMDVSIIEKTLAITGSKEALLLLAQNVRGLAETPYPQDPGAIRPHSHIEYYPGHFFLKPDAIPLIFTLRRS